jgi:hypothetical protein
MMTDLSGLLLRLRNMLDGCRKTLNEVFYGMTLHEMDLELKKDKAHLNNLFMLMIFGDLAGLPLLPPYYSMRLLPYIIPFYKTWRRNILREKDLTDSISIDV